MNRAIPLLIGLALMSAAAVAGCGGGSSSAVSGPLSHPNGVPSPAATTSLMPSPTPTQSLLGTIPSHVLTADYFYSFYGRSAASYAPWVTWAEASVNTATTLASVGIKTMMYANPNRERPGDPLYTNDESTFAHDCNGVRVSSAGGVPPYLMDPTSPNLEVLYSNLISTTLAQAHFDAIFEDNADDVYGLSGLPCNYSAASWLAASQTQIQNLAQPVIYNALGVVSGNTVSPAIALNQVSIGGMMESCYDSVFNPHQLFGLQWTIAENTEIQMAQQHKLFFCYANDTVAASASTNLRTFVDASFLLTYDLNTSVLWEYFSTGSGFHVEPESELVATAPLSSAPPDITYLRTSTGVYGREYGACFLAGQPVGPCAVVVNPDNSAPHAFPYSAYQHTLQLTGGGILDGATISTAGPPPPTSVAPMGAAIVFR